MIDLCAAPGGKTAQLIAAGAEVTAVDTSERGFACFAAILAGLAWTQHSCRPTDANSARADKVDAVLIDAPCSATGTLRRRPDVLMHRTPDDVATLPESSASCCEAASAWIKPGGCLIYATCSLQHDEGEDVIDGIVQDSRLDKMPSIRSPAAGGMLPSRPDLRTARFVSFRPISPRWAVLTASTSRG